MGKMENGQRRPRHRLRFELRRSKEWGTQRAIPLISLLTPSDVGSERKKEKKPEIKFDENQEDLPIMYHVSHEAHFGPYRAPFRGRQHLHRTNLRQQY